MSHEHFACLELAPNASENDIKKAYKRLALKYHPDYCPNFAFCLRVFLL